MWFFFFFPFYLVSLPVPVWYPRAEVASSTCFLTAHVIQGSFGSSGSLSPLQNSWPSTVVCCLFFQSLCICQFSLAFGPGVVKSSYYMIDSRDVLRVADCNATSCLLSVPRYLFLVLCISHWSWNSCALRYIDKSKKKKPLAATFFHLAFHMNNAVVLSNFKHGNIRIWN